MQDRGCKQCNAHLRSKSLSDEIKEICALKESAISDQNFEEAAEARDKEKNFGQKA